MFIWAQYLGFWPKNSIFATWPQILLMCRLKPSRRPFISSLRNNFWTFRLPSYGRFCKKTRLMRQKVLPLPTVGAPSASNSPSALSSQALRAGWITLSWYIWCGHDSRIWYWTGGKEQTNLFFYFISECDNDHKCSYHKKCSSFIVADLKWHLEQRISA